MTIQARYSGTCPECGDRWQPGDLIRAEAAQPGESPTWQHAVCPESVESLEGDVCPRCFLRRSLTGECGCES